MCFIPFTGTMNSTNWPAPNVWVFIAQLVEHCSANAEAMGSNPVKPRKHFSNLIDLFSLYILFSHFRLRDATRENSFFQMSSYARANLRITNEKQKENSLEGITWSEMGKQNVQAEKVYCDCLNHKHNCNDHTFISFACPQFT